MEINQVKFGNYTIGNNGARQAKQESKPEEKFAPEAGKGQQQQLNPEDMYSAMSIAGLQNKAQINFNGKKEIDPANFLSEERIADIEAMMEGFENGVSAIAEVVGEELPNISEANKNALAARIFAQG